MFNFRVRLKDDRAKNGLMEEKGSVVDCPPSDRDNSALRGPLARWVGGEESGS